MEKEQRSKLQKATQDAPMSVALRADGKQLASGSDDETLKLWDVATGKEISILGEHRGCVGARTDRDRRDWPPPGGRE